MDPDIAIPVIAFSEKAALEKRGIPRFIVKYQKFFFLPLLLFEAYSLRVGSIMFLMKNRTWSYRSVEVLLFVLHFALYFAVIFLTLGALNGLIFIIVHQALFGFYMASVFAPNHKGMLVVGRDEVIDFLRLQVLTARNVKAHPITDFWYGGLNYHVEHHLFPETYIQTLTRTYINGAGKRIMLSVAYGGTHGEGMQTHRPEICYPAQGFRVVKDTQPAGLSTQYGDLPIKRLVAARGPRNEPITYWVVVGNQQTQFGLRMKLAQMRYTLTGVIPDGMLVRVSSIDRDETGAYENQTDFIRAMIAAIRDNERERITGKFDS